LAALIAATLYVWSAARSPAPSSTGDGASPRTIRTVRSARSCSNGRLYRPGTHDCSRSVGRGAAIVFASPRKPRA
jgi:hypothetical protein